MPSRTAKEHAVPGIDNPLELAVVIPTYNERSNVSLLVANLEQSLAGIAWEAIFVDDDSPDGTSAEVHAIAGRDRRIRCIRRIGRRGLATAVVEGILSTSARYIAVLDADLQHDERILPAMLDKFRGEALDIVVASRHLKPDGMGEFPANRLRLSYFGTRLSRLVSKQQELTDPMSGFFVLRRSFFEEVAYSLSAVGFKILLDIIASAKRPVRIGEVGYTFRTRQFGESKLDLNVEVEYIYLLLDKLVGQAIPLRFALFALVGACGVAVHIVLFWALYYELGAKFLTAQLTGTYTAMAFNFFVNNVFTFRERRLHGRALVMGFVTFTLACSVGALTNISLAELLAQHGIPVLIAAAIGLIISSVWNYGMNEVFTWRESVKLRRSKLVSVESLAAKQNA